MTPIEFCEQWCSLNELQQTWVEEYAIQGIFFGVGKAPGQRGYKPVIVCQGKYYVIDSDGRNSPASTFGLKAFSPDLF